jgi:hypothetical protein
MNIERYRYKTVFVELLITEYCNFMCEHCMYDSGTHQSSEYMSDEVLEKIEKQVVFLKKIGAFPCVNILGGEPTINFEKFSHILDIVNSWDCAITISTNGWWLASEKATEKFFAIVGKYVTRLGGFLVRVSNDPYHEKIRKIKNIEHALQKIFANESLVKKLNIPDRIKSNFWIFEQNWSAGYYYVSPNGRGKDITNLDYILEVAGSKFCFHDLDKGKIEQIHYNPKGEVTDGCGYGSWYNFGTVDDNIIFIIEIIQQYKRDRLNSGEEYNCYTCREMVNEWKDEKLAEIREAYCNLNTFDLSIFGK